MSVAQRATPTASAESSVVTNARAAATLRLDSTRSAGTSTALARTWATGRNGSTLLTGSISSASASITTHSVPLVSGSRPATGSTRTEACAAAGTERASPRTISASPCRVAVSDDSSAYAAIVAPEAKSPRILACGSWAAISALAITDGTNGPGTAPRPNSAITIASSSTPKPCPPTDSARCTPCRPWSAAAFQ